MKLLIVTQKVDQNDSILGFFHRWIDEFAKKYNKVTVICLEEGVHNLPENVDVLSLGKEDGESRLKYIYKFYSYIWNKKKEYDIVFVHMNPIYVVLGGVVWWLLGKTVALWYTHESVDLKLRIAERFVDRIFTASKDSFQLSSDKDMVMGHGIDTKYFCSEESYHKNNTLKLLTVGRISPIKDYETLVLAMEILKKTDIKLILTVVGAPGDSSQQGYLESLIDMVSKKGLKDSILFVGAVSNNEARTYLLDSDIFVSMGDYGGLDKAILEAMSSGVVPVIANRGAGETLHLSEVCTFSKGDADELACRILEIQSMQDSDVINLIDVNRERIVKDHGLISLVDRLTQEMNKLYEK